MWQTWVFTIFLLTVTSWVGATSMPSLVQQLRRSSVLPIVDVTVKNGDDRTLLHHAAMLGFLDVGEHLIELGANPSAKDRFGKYPFDYAIEEDKKSLERYALAARLLEEMGGVNYRDNRGWTPLAFMILAGDFQQIKKLLERGAKIIRGSQSALRIAAMLGDKKIIALLLPYLKEQRGEDIAASDVLRVSQYAPDHGTVELMENFFAERVNAERFNRAVQKRDLAKIASYLAEPTTDVNDQDTWGQAALSSLASSNTYTETDLQIATMLIAHGAEIDLRDDKEGRYNALNHALANNKLQLFWFLIEQGADVRRGNVDSLISYSSRNDREDLLKFLEDQGIDLGRVMGKEGWTLLHWAVHSLNLKLVRRIVEDGLCDINFRSKDGYTVLAAIERDLDVMKKHRHRYGYFNQERFEEARQIQSYLLAKGAIR